jgi:hypothetical protein
MYGYGKSAKTLHCDFKHQLQCMDASLRLRSVQHDRTESIIPSASEESTHGCFTALSMTNWRWQTSPCCPSPCKRRGTSAPADRVRSIQRGCFTALRSVQHDRTESVIPNASEESTHGCFAALSMTNWRWQTSPCCPSPCKRRGTSAPADRVRSIQRGCFTALRSVQHDRTESVIPNASEESTHGCFAALSMTNWRWQTSPCCPSPCKRRGTSAPADRVRSIQRGCFAALCFVQHGSMKSVDASLRLCFV